MIRVKGADLLDGTPILDIKPYIPAVDSHPDAREGFAAVNKEYELTVEREYGMMFASYEVKFIVKGHTLTVTQIVKIK